LIIAIKDNRSEILDLLLDKRKGEVVIDIIATDINLTNTRQESVIFIACSIGANEIAEKLITKGANIKKADKRGMTPLYIAIIKGHLENS
jgi:ankyrin repeat protein